MEIEFERSDRVAWGGRRGSLSREGEMRRGWVWEKEEKMRDISAFGFVELASRRSDRRL